MRRWFVLWFVALSMFVPSAVEAGQSRYALLIENRNYDAAIGRIAMSSQSVSRLEAALKRLGFAVTVVHNSDSGGMVRWLEQHAEHMRTAASGSISIIYFSGHAVASREAKTNLLLGTEAAVTTIEQLRRAAVDLGTFREQLKEAAPRSVRLFVLDGCREALEGRAASKGQGGRQGCFPETANDGEVLAFAADQSAIGAELAETVARQGTDLLTAVHSARSRVKEKSGREPWLSSSLDGLPPPFLGPQQAAKAREASGDLITLASREVALSDGTTCVDLGNARGQFNAIRVRAQRGDIAVSRVSVRYNDGSIHNEDRLIDMKEGERSRPINPGTIKFIDHVNVVYKAGRGKGTLQVLGHQTSAEAGKKRLPLEKPVGCGSGGASAGKPTDSGQQIVTKPDDKSSSTATPGKPLAGGDVLLGTQAVGFGVDRDVIRVGNEIGKFDRVRLRVLDNDIHINELKVIYNNGEPDTLVINQNITKNSRSNWLNLKGDRFIKEIQMSYRSKPSLKGQARVEVFGQYADGWLAPSGEGRKYNQGWVLLGAQTSGFVGFDRDAIPVAGNEGGFDKIRITVKERSVTLNEVRVVYASGQEEIIPIKQRIDAGTSYGPIAIKGDSRAIKEIQAKYRSRFLDNSAAGKGAGILEVWAQAGSTGVKPPSSSSTVDRFVHLSGPEAALAGQKFAVSLTLKEMLTAAESQVQAPVTIKPETDSSVTPEGKLALNLEPTADTWDIDVDLVASGFNLEGGNWSRTLRLPRSGDSDTLRFMLSAQSGKAGERWISVRLWHNGRLLGSASRPIDIQTPATAQREETPAPAAARPAFRPTANTGKPAADHTSGAAPLLLRPPSKESGPPKFSMASIGEPADLSFAINYDDGDALGKGRLSIRTPHKRGGVDVEIYTHPQLRSYLEGEYVRLVKLGRAADAGDASKRESVIAAVQGLGAALYREYVPEQLKATMLQLESEGKLRSIQISTNSAVMPWEIVLPDRRGDGSQPDFLGITYRMARWSTRSSSAQLEDPVASLALSELHAIAPAYKAEQALAYQKKEIDALSKARGFQLHDGSFAGLKALMDRPIAGVVHFTGHGNFDPESPGLPLYSIAMSDGLLDPAAWGQLARNGASRKAYGGTLFFFNACEAGRSQSYGGFVQGWGPMVLSTGAGGFIGGQWRLLDAPAADFAERFYVNLSQASATGGAYLADALRDVRKRFHETGNPTYLAYAFYGDANLRIAIPQQ